MLLVLFALMLGIALRTENSTPIISVERISGTIVTLLLPADHPEALSNGVPRYAFGIRLKDNDALVFLDSEFPRLIGSDVVLERRRDSDGADSYKLVEN
jgi:hypothetical protein